MWVAMSAPLTAGAGVVPIGSPVPGAALFVLDGWLRPVPAGWSAVVCRGSCSRSGLLAALRS